MNDRERAGEQVAVMDEIVRVADEEAADAVIVAGDLFDTFNPPVEAIELLYRTLHRLARGGQRLVVAIAGNPIHRTGWIRPTCWHGRAGFSLPGTR